MEVLSQMCLSFRVKHSSFLSDFNEVLIILTDLRKKSSNIKFHENPSSVNQVVSCGQTDGKTDMTKLVVIYGSYANAGKNRS